MKSSVFFKGILLGVLLIPLLFFSHCTSEKASSSPMLEINGNTMGTTYMVKVVNPVHSREETAAGIEAVLAGVNRQMSTWMADSEISRFNRYDRDDWFDVSADTAMVVTGALRISELSGGAFDITAGALINLWGFGPGRKDGNDVVPDRGQIEAVMARIGYQRLSVRMQPPSLKKGVPGIYCDLSSIAKGFGVDRVAVYLDSLGEANYLVEIGGEVRARGVNAKGRSWRVAIASPGPGGGSPYRKVLSLKDCAMATSGDYFNYFEKDGVRYSHTIDPTTGGPITHTLASVTVIHDACMTADGMATAINVLGPEKGYELAVKEDLAVFLIIRDDDGFIEKMTPRFADILNRPETADKETGDKGDKQ